jgi:hypothetical protein
MDYEPSSRGRSARHNRKDSVLPILGSAMIEGVVRVRQKELKHLGARADIILRQTGNTSSFGCIDAARS